MLVVTRYRVDRGDEAFASDAERALAVLSEREGCLGAVLGRSVDDPELWTLTTTWRSVGDYRRALSHYDVKVHAVPLMYRAIDEPSAYEDLLVWSAQAGSVRRPSDRGSDGGSDRGSDRHGASR